MRIKKGVGDDSAPLSEHTRVHRRTRRGSAAPPGLKNFRANSVFRASASCSKILNDKIYFNAVKNSRATLFLRASADYSKLLKNKKYMFSTVISGHPLFFRASASCSKIQNVKSIFHTAKNFWATLFFRLEAQKSWMIKNTCSNTVKISGQLCFSGQAHANCSEILNLKSIFHTGKHFEATLFFRASTGYSKLLNNKNTCLIQ